jgi:uncharacterized protein (TIGR02996 family)
VSDHPDFLAAIVANPEEDATRLVYADYLDERAECRLSGWEADQARAELIRLQISVARGPDCPVCHKTGVFRGTHRLYCELMCIDLANTDVDPEKRVEYECRACHYKESANRVRWLLKTKYPALSPNGLAPLKIAGEELWNPAEFMSAREVRYVRGFVGVVALTHESFLARPAELVRAAPLEQIVLCDRVLNHNNVPFGRVGYFWVPDDVAPPPEAYGLVVAKSLFDLSAVLRDKDFADHVTDCYKWLSWAAIYYARAKAKLPAWTPRPALAPLYEPLKRWMPDFYFGPDGEPNSLTPSRLEIDPWIEQQYRDRQKPYVDYDGFAAYYVEDGFLSLVGIPSRTPTPLAPIGSI